MGLVQIIKTADQDFSVQWNGLRDRLSIEGAVLGDAERLATVRRIIDQVQNRGDEAISQLTEELDDCLPMPLARLHFVYNVDT